MSRRFYVSYSVVYTAPDRVWGGDDERGICSRVNTLPHPLRFCPSFCPYRGFSDAHHRKLLIFPPPLTAQYIGFATAIEALLTHSPPLAFNPAQKYYSNSLSIIAS